MAVGPAGDEDRARATSETAQRLLKSESTEDPRSMGTYLDASADLAQYGGLLEQLNLEAGAPKRQRGREPADPGSDYDDSHVREHLRSSASPAYAGVQGSLSYRSFCSKAGIRWKRAPDRQTSLKTQPLAR